MYISHTTRTPTSKFPIAINFSVDFSTGYFQVQTTTQNQTKLSTSLQESTNLQLHCVNTTRILGAGGSGAPDPEIRNPLLFDLHGQDTYRRCRRLASALTKRAVTFGCTVAVIAPNVPAMYEAHFGVPMSGAVINAVNIHLNAQTIAFF
ncbi:unnamed protein product [Fraxinus pennsylvanica]|uniref:AMP-dependent synthetase/ligase domain-containing protein n=1 Tax=Fraxinus pennsylvanica TaxID=56036 RepID=A0AAD2DUV4_9LAMI|nr:unnamed protein product [Fraxinus pennsylvanica]